MRRPHHARPGLVRTIVKVAIFAAASVLLTSIVFASLLDVGTQAASGYSADFTDASGLQAGDTVRIAGVEVGKVTAVSLMGNHAVISFSLDHSQHITSTTLAAIHFENLLGERFLALLPGRSAGKQVGPGSVIPLSRTTPAINLTAVFDGFQPLFSALAPGQVNDLANSIVQVFQGESGTVSNLVDETAVITNNLADRQQVIDALLTSLSSLLNTVGVHDTQLGGLIKNFDTLVRSLANSRSSISSAITNLSSLEATTSHLIDQSEPTLNEDIGKLATAVQSLSANQQGIDSVLQGFPGLVSALTKIQDSGNWINVYLCNLTLEVHGQLDISLVPGVSPPQYPDPVTLPSGPVGSSGDHTASCS
ncbi:MAG: MCE family protein [Acidimicrobiales bacterium]